MFQPLDNTTSFWNEKPVTRVLNAGGEKNYCNFLKMNTKQPSLKTGKQKVSYEIHIINHIVYVSTLK